MKKVVKFFGYTLLCIVVIMCGLIAYAKFMLPNVGKAPDLKVEQTPERIARGKYMADAVAQCLDCHSKRDWMKYAGPIVDGTLGMGGEVFDQKVGFPGAYYASNITPDGLSKYTDGELFRLITTGVTKDGRAIFPVMPYSHYGTMDPEDIYDIIAYIRTLPPNANKVAASVSDFPMNIIINTIPAKAKPGKKPAVTDVKAYGAYMVNAAGCIECHTRDKQGQIIPELAFSGGRVFKMPDGSVLTTPNITPDQATGIGSWSKEKFISQFKGYADSNYKPNTINPGQFNSLMPWMSYARMTREDLGAIYEYLHSLAPIQNKVVKFTPAGGTAKL